MSSKDKRKKAPLQLKNAWTDDELGLALPLPQSDDNKFTRGVLTVVAGSDRYPGAACLAARAGQRMGAGYTEVITTRRAADLVLAAYPSVVVGDVKGWRPGKMRGNAKGARHAVLIGSGFAPDDGDSADLVIRVLKKAKCPVLVDGGGLVALTSKKAQKALAKRRNRKLATVVTPHAGEAQRLQKGFGVPSAAPVQLSAALSMAMGAIVVLKGPDTYVAKGGRVFPMYEGTPALAKAGTGDVLAGMIASLLAQGADPVAAGVLGTTLHARAAIAAARELTEVAVTPEDVIEAIPAAVQSLGIVVRGESR